MLDFVALKTSVVMGLLVAFITSVPAVQAQSSVDQFNGTCQFFSNVAFRDRRIGGQNTFRMQLAQDCVDARIYAASNDPAEAERANNYLQRMEDYRIIIVGMLIKRSQHQIVDRSLRIYVQPAVYPVSRAGAYLIARDMGLVDHHFEWTNWRRAAARPLFRLDELSLTEIGG